MIALRGAELLALLTSLPVCDRDAWVDELLGIESLPPDVPDLPRGSVPYLPCGVEEILALVREVPVRAEDTFVDLGSGLGRVVILAHLLSGATALGVEIQDPLVRSAQERSAALGLTGVGFVCANAAEIALDGSIFFLYAPFNGAMLTAVLGRIAEVARRRPIIVCAVDLELHGASWLQRREPARASSLVVYDSVKGISERSPSADRGSP